MLAAQSGDQGMHVKSKSKFGRVAFSPSEKISQPRNFENMVCRQHGADEFPLRSSVYLIQVMLTYRLRKELPDAIVQSAFNYSIRAGTVGSANAFILD